MPDSPTPAPAVIAAYSWTPASACFRCGRSGVETAEVGYLPHRSISACATCVLLMEREREAAAERYGWPYAPGTPPTGRPSAPNPGWNP